MAIYALKTTGADPRYPSEVLEADGWRRFPRVLVFQRANRGWYEVPAERVVEVRRFGSRIEAEAWLAGRSLGPDAAGGARRGWQPPADLPPLVPGPGTAPSRKLTPTPLSAVLDTSGERVAVSPAGPQVEAVDVRLRQPREDHAATPEDDAERS